MYTQLLRSVCLKSFKGSTWRYAVLNPQQAKLISHETNKELYKSTIASVQWSPCSCKEIEEILLPSIANISLSTFSIQLLAFS
jgi:hypothetical protein